MEMLKDDRGVTVIVVVAMLLAVQMFLTCWGVRGGGRIVVIVASGDVDGRGVE